MGIFYNQRAMGLLLAHALATLVMAAAAWYVQLIHYPRLASIAASELAARARANIRRTAILVGPFMAGELACAFRLVQAPPAGVSPASAWTGLCLLAAVWLSSALVQLPIHRRLARGDDPSELGRLLLTNRLRVALWSARAALAVWLAARAKP